MFIVKQTLKVFSVLIALVLAIVTLFMALLATPQGTQLAWTTLNYWLPAPISLGTISGDLLSTGQLRDIDIRQDKNFVHIDHLTWRWQRVQPINATLTMDDVIIDGMEINWHSKKKSSFPEHFLRLYKRYLSSITVNLKNASIHNLRITDIAGTQHIIDHATLVASVNHFNVYLPKWIITTPLLTLSGHTRLNFEHQLSLQHSGEIFISPPNLAPLHLITIAQGDATQLHIEANSDTPYDAQFKLTLNDLKHQQTVSGTLTSKWLEPNKIKANWPNTPLQIKTNFTGTVKNPHMDLMAQVKKTQWGDFNTHLQADFFNRVLTLEQITLKQAASALVATGQAQLQIDKRPLHWNAQVHWKNFAWPLQPAKTQIADVKLPQGSFTIAGTTQAYTYILDTRAQFNKIKNSHIKIRGSGSPNALLFNNAQASLLQGQVKGRGKLSWSPNLMLTGQLTGTRLNTAELNKNWPSALTMASEFHLQSTKKTPLQIALDHFTVTGWLKRLPLHINTQLNYQPQKLFIRQLTAGYGDSTLTAQGNIGKQSSQLQLALQAKNIEQWLPQGAGNVNANAQLSGPWTKPTIRSSISAENFQFGEFSTKTLNGSVALNTSPQQSSSATLELNSGHIKDYPVDHLRLAAQGSLAHHTFDMALTSPQLTAQGKGQGRWNTHEQWQFTLQQAEVKPEPLPAWTLSAPVTGLVSRTEQSVSPHCWNWSSSQLCFDLAHNASLTQSQLSLDQLPLNYFEVLLPAHAQPIGTLSASAEFTKKSGHAPIAQALIATSAGHLYDTSTVAGQTNLDDVNQFSFHPSTLKINTTPQGLSSSFLLDFPQQGITTGEINFPHLMTDWPHWRQSQLQGNSQIELRQLAFLSEWLPHLEILEGQWHSDFSVMGTLDKPQFAGQGILENGHILLAGPEIELTQVTGTVNDIHQQGLSTSITARSGQGAIALTGKANFEEKIPHITGTLSGDHATLINTKEYQIIASPNISFALTNHILNIQGTLDIPQAQLSPKDFTETQGISPSADQEIIQANNDSAKTPTKNNLAFNSDILLALGDKVFFEGFGLKSRLSGNLHITERAGEKALASGQILIEEGRYRGAYGQDLAIQNGRLLFAGGPLAQPGIDLQAIRKIDDETQVGINARGTLTNPNFSLFSTPAMSQSEQLSYLVLGTPLEDTSQGENNTLLNAALSFGLKQSGHLAQDLGRRVGIDEISIDTIGTSTNAAATGTTPADLTQQAALSIGKYLSPKLYISYGIGLLDPISTVKLRYRINKHWRFHTESSAKATSGDLIYEVERGK